MKNGTRIFRKGLLLLFAAALAVGPARAAGQNAPAPVKWSKDEVKTVTNWLKERAIPLVSVRAGAGFDDLRPLESILKDVRVVGLGEATHGTREFFQFKHRMLEFLVKKMGFTVFAIEASYPACWNVNDYVLNGKGDPAAALASQGFWTWDTNEVTDMIAWMREYNKTAPEDRKVRFLGYDIQHLGRVMTVVAAYLERLDRNAVPMAKAALEPLIDMKRVMALRDAGPEERAKIKAAYDGLLAFIAFNRTPYVRGSSAAEYEEVMQHIRVVGQFFNSYSVTPATPAEAARLSRDFYMADNIWQLMQTLGPDTKMAVWAHNAHVSRGDMGETPAMGAYLKQFFGDAYYALGFAFDKGAFQSCDMDSARNSSEGCVLTEFTVGAAPEGSVDAFLAKAGIPNYIVDVKWAPRDPTIAKWLATEMPMRSIGSGYSVKEPGNFFAPTRIDANYDGLVFFGTTTRALPNPTGMRPKKTTS
jgi:erythromycin esterase